MTSDTPATTRKKTTRKTSKKTSTKTSKKKTSKKSSSKKTSTSKKAGARSTTKAASSAGGGSSRGGAPDARGKKLVVVESPAKARTINKYLGPDFVVMATVGHIRDLPSKNPKGEKSPVPGVDLENNFAPTYEVLPGKAKTVADLKRAAKQASEVWFATDLDREGEAIAWHLAQLIGIDPKNAKRVVFNAITKMEIQRAFQKPHTIDVDRVDAQQARRVLDRIVGYQVSPLLWKKVARGLSAGRVQSVAVRLVVEREREIRVFVPDEFWKMTARFALDPSQAAPLVPQWHTFIQSKNEKGATPTLKAQNQWLAKHSSVKAELVGVGKGEDSGQAADVSQECKAADGSDAGDLTPRVMRLAALAGLRDVSASVTDDPKGKGPAKFRRSVTGEIDPATPYAITSIETKRTTSRPPAPFITSTLQQAASTRMSFGAQRTMRTAQRLYEGINIPGEGSVGLITYMRTDSTHLSGESITSVRSHIKSTYGDDYLPHSPNTYTSSNKGAQEAHEAIRPTSLAYPPSRVRGALKDDEYKLYSLIWSRFVACQMTPAKWDATTVLIEGGTDKATPLTFKATGRVLVFDGFYRELGVPTAADEQTLPPVEESQKVGAFSITPEQRFTSPPPRYSEASLIKTLESEGIGRPSTYASIIQVIQDRKYVENVTRRFFATDLGEVVTDKLIEAFPNIMGLDFTREMEAQLDTIEEKHVNWVTVIERFYGPFEKRLARAHEDLVHAKAEITEAPDEYRCGDCGSPTVYRFGKNGRFLSCSQYPTCKYACPIDREGHPKPPETTQVACHKCGSPMMKRSGRFGPFLGCTAYPACDGILKLNKEGCVVPPAVPPLETDIPCAKCESPLNLRNGARGPWLSCSTFPKCRGRGKWRELSEEEQKQWEAALEAHEEANPMPVIRTLDGTPLTDDKGKPLPGNKAAIEGDADEDGGADQQDRENEQETSVAYDHVA